MSLDRKVATLTRVNEAENAGLVTSARQAAAVCGVTRFAVRAWIDAGLLPPWTVQLRQVNDAAGPRPGPLMEPIRSYC